MKRLKAKYAYTIVQLRSERGLPPWHEVPLAVIEAALMCCGGLLLYVLISPEKLAVPRVLAVINGLVFTPAAIVFTPFAYWNMTTGQILTAIRYEKMAIAHKINASV